MLLPECPSEEKGGNSGTIFCVRPQSPKHIRWTEKAFPIRLDYTGQPEDGEKRKTSDKGPTRNNMIGHNLRNPWLDEQVLSREETGS